MARKYDLISELYNRTCKTVVSNPQNWQAFLASACRNYKLRYDEQLLVYAQRPDATAVLEIEQWNKIFGRWVNRGARGIAVFADENRSRQRLTHYFDISDTHESRYSRTVPVWDMRQEYEADVIETLESTFGEIENKSSLAEAIMGAARNAAEDNIPDYLQDLYYATEGSSFEEVEEDIVAFIYKNVVTNSVAYMMMSRLGVDTDGYFELDDFRDVTNFNTQETLNALHLWEGKYDSRTAQSYYDWAVIARHFEAMRLLGELSDSIKPLPSMDGQMTFILDGWAEEKKTSAFTFSQEIIDAVLANGSGFSEGKMRIYEQFEKSLSAKENADFLKNEYGWGGSYPVIIGAGIDESHDGKGITITKGIGKEKPHITLSWSQVEKRIGELIRMDRYLNPKEKEHYPQWLESQEERRAKIEETKRNREILSNAPPEQEVEPTEKEPEEAEQLQDVQYEYHLGDKVYIGASEYEILSVDDERVMLYDYDMPLFNKEFSRTEFDRKVRENPINEHLIVKEEPAEERNDKEPEPVVPAWEQKKKVKGFDLHPDVPMADRHTFNLRENEVETVGKKERFRRNIMAIQLLKKCQEENRFATPEEQIILSKYVGWGGLSEAFDENNSAWATEYLELSSVLTPEEYASARESTLTAFYTPPEVITAIYKAMEQMGFKEGNLLEPSCGIGNFIGMLPDTMQDSKIYGVELDTISAGIAQQLYQKTTIAAQGFEETNLPDSFFDGVVGNVPFGDFKVSDKRYDKHKFLIHDYFFAKSLDKLRPGGVMMD